MAEHVCTTFSGRAPAPPPTLSAIATALGSLEPKHSDDEVTHAHLARQTIIFNAAAFLPVRSGGDAALALSAAASGLDGLLHYELSEAQRERTIHAAMNSIATVASWLMTEHGGIPIASAWPPYANPFASEVAQA
ncbi:hypothetical protein GXW78_06095 [Roseomonas terrae]|uniref:Uncharacterized protein n=1 Tax=Neoroseomonas terrae TaxID=424799 RepID=A0ABS5EDX6_9PROT|nr:hypothetical protein [Neoroseomonas terrae]MBR0649225.1 hypothetical protein [Neoroseomonas terrae]